jgi:hypothetical protein
MRATRALSTLLILALAAILVAPPTEARPALDIPGSVWSGTGTAKVKVSAMGESDSTKGPVAVLLELGPVNGLAGDEFRLTLDDGVDALVLGGTYSFDAKDRPVMVLDQSAAETAFLDLWALVVDDFFPGLSLPTPDITIDKLVLKARPKAKSSGDKVKPALRSKWYLDFAIVGTPVHVKMKLNLNGKCYRVT